LITFALTALTAALMMTSKTEAWSGMNYRMLAQSRYGAEAGLHRGANYLLNGYTPPGGPADPLANYDLTVTPVTYNGAPVVLSSMDGVASNYPVAAVVTAFQAASQGALTADTFVVTYAAYATLLSMRQIMPYGTTTPVTIQTWQITASGSIGGARKATQEVSAILEQQISPAFAYAVFADANGCAALNFGGGATVDSYDSGNIQRQNGQVVTQSWGGNVGTNGNLTEVGHPTTVYGTLSTPRTGVGVCNVNNVNAWTNNGIAQVTGGTVELAQSIAYPTPAPPNPLPPTDNLTIQSTQTLSPPGPYGNIMVNAGATVHLTAGTYTLNSITLNGNSTLVVDSGPVILNVAGQSQNTPINFTGGALVNSALDPEWLQIQYAGTGQVLLTGGDKTAALVYAPNATVNVTGGSNLYGAIVANSVGELGGAAVHYDRRLLNNYFTIGNPMLDSFTWKTY
jgi:hypothetical protein